MISVTLQYDMRAPDHAIPPEALYLAALDQSEWADRIGLQQITLAEHHETEDGYLPSPLVLGGAIAGRTKRIEIGFSVLLLPFYDVPRLAEDIAVLDLISQGRVRLAFGSGYRPEEFERFGIALKQRGPLMEEGIETLKKAWTGEPFEYRGKTIRILPRPLQKPRPRISMGGVSPASAKRAARIADDYTPVANALYDLFLEERKRLGLPAPDEPRGNAASFVFIHVSDDPERDWPRVAPYLMHDLREYGKWTKSMPGGGFGEAKSLDELRKNPLYRVMTPAECIAFAKSQGQLIMRPLCGGMDPDLAWESLKRFEQHVLPQLR